MSGVGTPASFLDMRGAVQRTISALHRRVRPDQPSPMEIFYQDEQRDLERFMRRAFYMLVYNKVTGDYAEFGCHGARTFTLAARTSNMVAHGAHHWAFDSFVGLPSSEDPRDQHSGWTAGAMAMSELEFVERCRSLGIEREAFTTVPGFYAQTLLAEAPGPRPQRVCFAYIDCDLYTSTIQALHFLEDRLCHGAVLALDDYYCYSETHPSGERLALIEVFHDHPRWQLLPYRTWGWHGQSFVVEDRDTAPAVQTVW